MVYVGIDSPVITEHVGTYVQCKSNGLSLVRVVPIDGILSSMPYNSLALFCKSFGRYDREVRLKFLKSLASILEAVEMEQEGRR